MLLMWMLPCRELQASGARKALTEVLRQVEQTDLMTYGLIPEFVGRFPIVTTLQVSIHTTRFIATLTGLVVPVCAPVAKVLVCVGNFDSMGT